MKAPLKEGSHLHTHAHTHTQVCAPDRSPSHCKLDFGFARDRARTAAGRGLVMTLFTDRDPTLLHTSLLSPWLIARFLNSLSPCLSRPQSLSYAYFPGPCVWPRGQASLGPGPPRPWEDHARPTSIEDHPDQDHECLWTEFFRNDDSLSLFTLL